MRYLLSIVLMILLFTFTGCKTTEDLAIINNDTITFTDYYGNRRTAFINPLIKKNNFNPYLFKTKGNILKYEDNEYVTRLGVDVSYHDGKINWKKLRKENRDFVIIRIGYRGYQTGVLFIDKKFHENIKNALENGFDVGVYIFSQAINEKEALEEADLVINELKNYRIQLPVVFDPENIGWEDARTDNLGKEVFMSTSKAFCSKIKEAGYEPMIYCNLTWQMFMLDLYELNEYKIWYADYHKIPETPYNFDYWQYSSSQRVKGIKKKCDADIMIIRK